MDINDVGQSPEEAEAAADPNALVAPASASASSVDTPYDRRRLVREATARVLKHRASKSGAANNNKRIGAGGLHNNVDQLMKETGLPRAEAAKMVSRSLAGQDTSWQDRHKTFDSRNSGGRMAKGREIKSRLENYGGAAAKAVNDEADRTSRESVATTNARGAVGAASAAGQSAAAIRKADRDQKTFQAKVEQAQKAIDQVGEEISGLMRKDELSGEDKERMKMLRQRQDFMRKQLNANTHSGGGLPRK